MDTQPFWVCRGGLSADAGTIFQQHAPPLGKLQDCRNPVGLRAIRKTALLTVEEEKNDMCMVGRTLAMQ